jgi:threonine dehydrogenase-like Zn-dependent dehydrogenase
LNFDLIDKVTRPSATVAVTGISTAKKKFSLSYALDKELDVKFIKNGNENVNAGINLIAQKAINLSYFELSSYKFEYAPKHFENAVSRLENDDGNAEFIIDML